MLWKQKLQQVCLGSILKRHALAVNKPTRQKVKNGQKAVVEDWLSCWRRQAIAVVGAAWGWPQMADLAHRRFAGSKLSPNNPLSCSLNIPCTWRLRLSVIMAVAIGTLDQSVSFLCSTRVSWTNIHRLSLTMLSVYPGCMALFMIHALQKVAVSKFPRSSGSSLMFIAFHGVGSVNDGLAFDTGINSLCLPGQLQIQLPDITRCYKYQRSLNVFGTWYCSILRNHKAYSLVFFF